MKKMVAIALSLWTACCCGGCAPDNTNGNMPTDTPVYEYVSLLKDKNFNDGFIVRGLGHSIYDDEIELYDNESKGEMLYFTYEKQSETKPSWMLQQWATRYPFHDVENSVTEWKNGKETYNYRFTDDGDGRYVYDNQSKTVCVDTKTGGFSLDLRASECYKYDRIKGQEWPHLLLSQNFGDQPDGRAQCALKNTDSLKIQLDCKVDYFKDRMQGAADTEIHSAVCMLYLFVSYKPEDSAQFTDMLWFGLTLFDNRTSFSTGMSGPDSGTKESETDKWIYNIPSTKFFDLDNNLYDINGNVKIGEWAHVEVDVYNDIVVALSEAHHGGAMQGATLDNLYISGMYIGFELPGTYDMGMSFKNLDILSYVEI